MLNTISEKKNWTSTSTPESKTFSSDGGATTTTESSTITGNQTTTDSTGSGDSTDWKEVTADWVKMETHSDCVLTTYRAMLNHQGIDISYKRAAKELTDIYGRDISGGIRDGQRIMYKAAKKYHSKKLMVKVEASRDILNPCRPAALHAEQGGPVSVQTYENGKMDFVPNGHSIIMLGIDYNNHKVEIWDPGKGYRAMNESDFKLGGEYDMWNGTFIFGVQRKKK